MSYIGGPAPHEGVNYTGGETVSDESGVWTADPNTDARFVAHFAPAVPEASPLLLFGLAFPVFGVSFLTRRVSILAWFS